MELLLSLDSTSIVQKVIVGNHYDNYPCRYAYKVSVDDEVLIQGNIQLNPVKVNNISTLFMQGESFSSVSYTGQSLMTI